MRLPLPLRLFWIPLVAACAKGSTGPVPGGGGALSPPSELAALPGLRAMVAGPGALHVSLRSADAGVDSALFVSTSHTDVYANTPRPVPSSVERFAVTGLSDGAMYFVGLGLRAVGEADYRPAGLVLSGRPGATIFVDAAADPSLADGLRPDTAFADVTRAMLTAFSLGGANVWVRSGDYPVANVPLFAGVHVYGGFDDGFEPARRDLTEAGTRWNSVARAVSVGIQGGTPAAVLDGIHLLGRGVGAIGIDARDATVELRSVSVSGFLDRGIRLRNTTTDDYDFVVTHADIAGNGGDGVSIDGAFDVLLDASRFRGNGQEGVELDALVALEGDTARLVVRACAFSGNASEGLDADLEAPLVTGAGGARFDVRVDGSTFGGNGLDGLLIDLDFEGVLGWSASVAIRDSCARANGGSGFHVDADAASDVYFHRVVATANAGDGVLVSSESEPGLALIAGSVVAANLGAGVRATFGNRTVVASHCVFAGNEGGGLVSDTVESAVSSSVFWLQPNPVVGARATSSPIVADAIARVFANAPEAYLRAVGRSGNRLSVSPSTDAVPSSASIELEDDGVRRAASIASDAALTIDDLPAGLRIPSSVVAFAPGADVGEDYHVVAGSLAEGAALVAPGALALDAGVYPVIGERAPGVADAFSTPVFRPVATIPALASGVAEHGALTIVFSQPVDPTSFVLDTVRAVDRDGNEIEFTLATSGDRVVLDPTDGWGAEPFVVELHTALLASDGTRLATSLVLPIRTRP